MKTPKLSNILLAIFLLLFTTCKDREITNPFDTACPKEVFTPSDFKAEQKGAAVQLSWKQANTKISGFVINRNENDGTFNEIARVDKAMMVWSENNIVGGKKYGYQLYAYAGENLSNPRIVNLTPITGAIVTTSPEASGITTNSAVLGGNVSDSGGASVIERGFCYSNSPSPTTSNTKIVIGIGLGEFIGTISGLTPNTTYYAKAYAINSQGTAYGKEITFKTVPLFISITPPFLDVPKDGGSFIFSISSNIDWQAASDQSWCKLNTTVGNGNSTLVVTYSANPEVGNRLATLTFSGIGISNQIVNLNQTGTEPFKLTVIPESQSVSYRKGQAIFSISSNVGWTATSDQAWCTINSEGSFNSPIIANFNENTTGSKRTASITVKASGLTDQKVLLIQRPFEVNVALANNGAIATAISSGYYDGITHIPAYAIDGDSISYWSSQWDMPAWVQVQFSKTYSISTVGVWWGGCQHTFSISLSIDGNSWTVVVPSRLSGYNQGTPIHELYDITPMNAKYIKCNITSTNAPWSWIFQSILHELEAYGK